MCGIFAIFGYGGDIQTMRPLAVACAKRVRHRGPDWSGVAISENNILCHERLAIVGVDSGAQPLSNEDGTLLLSVNGEIYNHVTLRKLLKKPHTFKTHSDCEIILHLYEEMGADLVPHLDGMFSFILYDTVKKTYLCARDHVGITTLYQGWRHSDKSVWFASEMKSLSEDCDRIIAFPPGHYYTSSDAALHQWYHPKWYDDVKNNLPPLAEEQTVQTEEEDAAMYVALREKLEKAVKKRLMTEVPYGVLLSGGLDSSLIAAIASRIKRSQAEEDLRAERGASAGNVNDDDDTRSAISQSSAWPRLHTFSIGLPNAPDLVAAQRVATFLKSAHHEFTFTVAEGIDAIEDVIYHLETYDVTTVRASTPMYLMSRKIKAIGVKMVLSGEGSDEIFAGYLYFHQSPSAQALHHECISRIQNLHTSDCLRANKATMAWGLEARVPFLDRAFLDTSMLQVPANHKLSKRAPYNHYMEKYVIRRAFDIKEDPYLPHDILWRQKEQFSDGVGYTWIDSLKDHAEKMVTDEQLAAVAERFPHDPPTTKEGYWYREVFEKHFPSKACLESVVRWIPRKDWGCAEDPSGRAQKVHEFAYDKNAAENGIAATGNGAAPAGNGVAKRPTSDPAESPKSKKAKASTMDGATSSHGEAPEYPVRNLGRGWLLRGQQKRTSLSSCEILTPVSSRSTSEQEFDAYVRSSQQKIRALEIEHAELSKSSSHKLVALEAWMEQLEKGGGLKRTARDEEEDHPKIERPVKRRRNVDATRYTNVIRGMICERVFNPKDNSNIFDDASMQVFGTADYYKTAFTGQYKEPLITHQLVSQPVEKEGNTSKEAKVPAVKEVSRLAALARPEYAMLAGAIVLLIISSAVTMSVPFSMGRILDIVMASLGAKTGTTESASAMSSLGAGLPLSAIFAILIGVFSLGALANTGRVILIRIAGERIVTRLRNSLFANFMRQDVKFFDMNRTGDLVSRLSSDTQIVGKTITNNVSDGLRSLAMSGVGVSMMLYMNQQLTLIMLSIVPPLAIGAVIYGRMVRDLSTRTQDAVSETTKVAEEKLGNLRTVRAFAQESKEITRYAQRAQSILDLAKKEAYASGVFFGGAGLSGNIVILALLYYGGAMVTAGSITIGELTSFFLYTAYVGSSLVGMSSFYSELMKGLGASSRLFAFLDSKAVIESKQGATLPSAQGRIEFKEVHFKYPTRTDVNIFNGLTFTVPSGGHVAIVGRSGSGKSSVAQLLLRFYDPDQGSVYLDGVDMKTLNPTWLRENVVGLVSQEPVLFAATIGENIAYGSPNATEAEIRDAAAQANALDFIEDIGGFDVFVGEKGAAISGGQKQRIAIARALLKNPKLLILDEATSALDGRITASEHLVQDALDKLVHGRTVVTIAHRLSTISKSDWVIMIEDGIVAEQGTFVDLINNTKNGRFRALVEQQLGGLDTSLGDEETGTERRTE
ncbi:asparagine synthase (glutamine-hydrolysing) [Synchytrium microbalum]|uniref:asparagine synthase (glutamine-hydrolyzing) n=1 Tax=Synchytrium microbalum TaxID=1806994 RepID=A0A507C371_9FUNG|nr:asparagine synthase (glutamine-hydrolysing) [Synchytrium microbalum]TPX31995.1 asparagine synthase (glutamine-hydrolysing) [Synchytrium microbalum]